MLRSSGLFLQRFSSSACYCFYLLSCGLVSVGGSLLFLASFPPSTPGGRCCSLPFWVVPFLDLLSGTVDVRGSLSSSFVVSVPGGRFDTSLRLISLCDLFVLFLFSYSCYFSSLSYWCSFRVSSCSFLYSFSCCPPFLRSEFLCELLFFFVGFFSFSSLLFLFLFFFFSSFLFLRPHSSVSVSGVWDVGFLGLSL